MYAFCRLADDAIDEGSNPALGIQEFHDRLEAIYSGNPRAISADRAFAQVVHEHSIPRIFPASLLEGFRWDVEARRYETLSELESYAVRVAGTVGGMMALILGAQSRTQIARAIDLGVAMQLTNIARDVGEDARAGRLYLPLRSLREGGIDPDEWLRNPQFNPVIEQTVARLLERAQTLYRQSEAGIESLPFACRPGMRAARLLYSRIGETIIEQRLDPVGQRAVVSGAGKARAFARAWLGFKVLLHEIEELPEASFLLQASPGRTQLDATGIEWVIELFQGLQRREYSS
jgi:phytoene synthase